MHVINLEDHIVALEDHVVVMEDCVVELEDCVVDLEDCVVELEDCIVDLEDCIVDLEDCTVDVENCTTDPENISLIRVCVSGSGLPAGWLHLVLVCWVLLIVRQWLSWWAVLFIKISLKFIPDMSDGKNATYNRHYLLPHRYSSFRFIFTSQDYCRNI